MLKLSKFIQWVHPEDKVNKEIFIHRIKVNQCIISKGLNPIKEKESIRLLLKIEWCLKHLVLETQECITLLSRLDNFILLHLGLSLTTKILSTW